MSGIIILCRHGNTFEKGEKVFVVGAREDLSLTAFGREQGRYVGRALSASGHVPIRLISGPLKRTREFAAEIAAETHFSPPVEIDERLREFDFGEWSGLSDDEIVALSGREALRRWHEESVRPTGITFTPSEARAREDARAVLQDLEQVMGVNVVVTSNGRLREVGKLLQGHGAEDPSYKVKTGHSCVLLREANAWKVIGWDLSPDVLLAALTSIPKLKQH